MRLVLLGPPGAGKGTQAVHIAREFAIPRIATGDIFRENVKLATPLGREAKAYMDRGALVPDEVTIRMVEDRLDRPDAAGGFLLDGFPRTTAQADALEAVLAASGRPLTAVLRFLVNEDELVGRIVRRRVCPNDGMVYHLDHNPPRVPGECDECGAALIHRDDDTAEVVRRRLEEYHAKTELLERYYEDRGLLLDVKASGPVHEVTERTLQVLHVNEGDAA